MSEQTLEGHISSREHIHADSFRTLWSHHTHTATIHIETIYIALSLFPFFFSISQLMAQLLRSYLYLKGTS